MLWGCGDLYELSASINYKNVYSKKKKSLVFLISNVINYVQIHVYKYL